MAKGWEISALASTRYVFVGGKGGVGKTSVSCAIALGLAKRHGKRVLLISTDPAHNVSDCLEQRVTGEAKAVEGAENVWAIETDPSSSVANLFGDVEEAAQAQGADLFKQLQQMLAEMKGWMSSLPGVDEAVALIQILEADSGIERKYDCVVLDTAPTGHTLKLLNLPAVLDAGIKRLESWQTKLSGYINMAAMWFSQPGDTQQRPATDILAEKLRALKGGVEKLREMLTDQAKTTFVCVAIAESLSVQETKRLVGSLQQASVDTRFLVVNKLMVQSFLPREGDEDSEQQPPPDKKRKTDESAEDLRDRALFLCRSRAIMQNGYLEQLKENHKDSHTIVQVEELPFEPKGVERLLAFLDTFSV